MQSDVFKVDTFESNDSVLIMLHEVYQTIKKLPDNKANGLENICAEHLKNASMRL